MKVLRMSYRKRLDQWSEAELKAIGKRAERMIRAILDRKTLRLVPTEPR